MERIGHFREPDICFARTRLIRPFRTNSLTNKMGDAFASPILLHYNKEYCGSDLGFHI